MKATNELIERLRDREASPEDLTDAADLIASLTTESWQLKQALGYPIPAELESLDNPFRCGICDARISGDANWTKLYEAAVKGRMDFRQAFRKAKNQTDRYGVALMMIREGVDDPRAFAGETLKGLTPSPLRAETES